MKTPKEILESVLMYGRRVSEFLLPDQMKFIEDAIAEAQKEAWNEAIKAAAKNATAYDSIPRPYSGNCVVDKESILKIKK